MLWFHWITAYIPAILLNYDGNGLYATPRETRECFVSHRSSFLGQPYRTPSSECWKNSWKIVATCKAKRIQPRGTVCEKHAQNWPTPFISSKCSCFMTTLPYVSLSNMYHAIWISSTKYRCCHVKPSIKKKSNSFAWSCLQVRNDRWLITPNYSFIQHSDLLQSLNESNQIKMSASFTCHSKTTIMWLFNELFANSTNKIEGRW